MAVVENAQPEEGELIRNNLVFAILGGDCSRGRAPSIAHRLPLQQLSGGGGVSSIDTQYHHLAGELCTL